MVTGLREGKLWTWTSCKALKNWPCFTSCSWWRGWVNTYIIIEKLLSNPGRFLFYPDFFIYHISVCKRDFLIAKDYCWQNLLNFFFTKIPIGYMLKWVNAKVLPNCNVYFILKIKSVFFRHICCTFTTCI